MLRLFFRTDRVNFSMVGPTTSRFFTRFSDAANEVVEARMFMGIHFRFADTAARSQGNACRDDGSTRVSCGRSTATSSISSGRSTAFEDLDLADEDDGQDDDDAE